MPQTDILDFLRRNPNRWFSSRIIAKNIGNSRASTSTLLRKIRKSNAVEYKLKKMNKKGRLGGEPRKFFYRWSCLALIQNFNKSPETHINHKD